MTNYPLYRNHSFQSLMTGLMYYKPEDHITFLQECLRKVKHEGIDQVKWNIFIESRKKTPLPPISSDGSSAVKRDPSFITGSLSITVHSFPYNSLMEKYTELQKNCIKSRSIGLSCMNFNFLKTLRKLDSVLINDWQLFKIQYFLHKEGFAFSTLMSGYQNRHVQWVHTRTIQARRFWVMRQENCPYLRINLLLRTRVSFAIDFLARFSAVTKS